MKIYIGVRAEESLLSDRINNELLIIKFGPHSTVGIPAKGPISPPAAGPKRKRQAERNSHLVQSVKYFNFG